MDFELQGLHNKIGDAYALHAGGLKGLGYKIYHYVSTDGAYSDTGEMWKPWLKREKENDISLHSTRDSITCSALAYPKNGQDR